MFRSRGENLRSIYILLFLMIALFFLEYDDAQKYARLFSFERNAVADGEVWRIFTYQFTQAGQGWFAFPSGLKTQPISLTILIRPWPALPNLKRPRYKPLAIHHRVFLSAQTKHRHIPPP